MENQTTVCLPPQQLAITISFSPNKNQLPNHDTTCTINHQTDDLPSFRDKLFFDITQEFKRRYTTELLLASAYLWILRATSFSHLALAFDLLEDKTGHSKSVQPIVMSFFKYSLAIFASFSMASAEVNSHMFKTSVLKKIGFFGMGFGIPLVQIFTVTSVEYRRIIFCGSDFIYLSCTGGFNGYGKHGWLLNFAIYLLQLIIAFPIGVRAKFSSSLVLVISVVVSSCRAAYEFEFFTSSAPSLLCCIDKSIQKLLPVVAARLKLTLTEKKKVGKFVKYAIGLVGTLIFQNFFRLTTFIHVRAFMYLATSWLANIALLNVANDYGILNFLLGNMILGSTVNQSGLGITTWISYCVCLFIYILGIKLKSMNITQNFEKSPRPPIIFWIFYCCASFDSYSYLITKYICKDLV